MNTQLIRSLSARKGVALMMCLIFMALFSALTVGLMATSSTNAQVADNHRKTNTAMNSALSGLECAKSIIAHTPTISTNQNTVTAAQANTMWANLCSTLQSTALGGLTVGASAAFTDGVGTGVQIVTPAINFGSAGQRFTIRFYRYDANPTRILVDCTGNEGTINRKVHVEMDIRKQADVLNYAIASRGRMWVTQNSVIHGPIYSSWNRPSIGTGIETTADTTIEGTIGTAITLANLQNSNLQMETLDADDQPVYDAQGNRVVSTQDTIQGGHEGILYGVQNASMPGMSPTDYNTAMYKSLCTTIATSATVRTEYFPYAATGYTVPMSSASKRYDRKVYENMTFSNVKVPKGTHALFKNCTFQNVLFIEANATYSDSATYTNNTRFENCTFNGAIVTDVPTTSNTNGTWWMRNAMTFTGTATFNNQSQFRETTILAPNFNVNIGNTGSFESGSENVLTGAIVGGIVDVRGNARIYGTIISMFDTSTYSSGYVTNIGAANDGGSESVGYSGGTIEITPDPERLLPSGITTPVIISPVNNTYSELCS
jgi:Tfp pilus assembly protein PilX